MHRVGPEPAANVETEAMAHNRLVRANVVISGRVQGVGFRYATYHAARQNGVRGWVRNRPDGRVEAELEGDDLAVGRVVAWCRHGPPGARVEGIDVRWEAPTGTEFGFNIARTPLE
jgi:acylphosphatase